MNWPIFALGIVVAGFTSANVLFTMVLPRRPFGIDRIELWINRGVLVAMSYLSRASKTYERKDAVLSPMGPFALLLQLVTWAAGLTVGFGLLIAATHHSLGNALLQAVTSLFTLGAAHEGGRPEQKCSRTEEKQSRDEAHLVAKLSHQQRGRRGNQKISQIKRGLHQARLESRNRKRRHELAYQDVVQVVRNSP